MRTFLIIWLGQFASLLGSEMTNFAITIWAWEVTGQATLLAMITVAVQIPRLLISPFAGVWVDRLNRKVLMVLGDTIAGLSTIVLLALFLTDQLQIWHLYISGAINGLFGYIQGLAYSTSLSLMVADKHYTRISAFQSLRLSSSYVIVPVIAGAVYAVTGLSGILTIDLVTFGVAIATLIFITIPQPSQPSSLDVSQKGWQQLMFGFQYLWQRLNLRVFLSFFMVINFVASLSFSILPAMILARLGNDSTLLGTMLSCFGIGGVLGGLTLSLWGGPKRRIHGILIFFSMWQLGLVVLAMTQNIAAIWAITIVCGFCAPFPGSCAQAIWRSQVEPGVQGRVFATRFLLTQVVTPLGGAIAGPLADYVFEPAMQTGTPLALALGNLFGSGIGAGMSVQVALFASCGVVVTLGGYAIRQLRWIESCDSLN
ncbi:MAG: MFS transporter [Cyanobacteria bacterium P01_G01_bin.54]